MAKFFDSRFLGSYKFAYKVVTLFYDNPNMIYLNPVFFIKGNHYLLESLFMLKYKSKFKIPAASRGNNRRSSFPC
jgi:hypothetical protein